MPAAATGAFGEEGEGASGATDEGFRAEDGAGEGAGVKVAPPATAIGGALAVPQLAAARKGASLATAAAASTATAAAVAIPVGTSTQASTAVVPPPPPRTPGAAVAASSIAAAATPAGAPLRHASLQATPGKAVSGGGETCVIGAIRCPHSSMEHDGSKR